MIRGGLVTLFVRDAGRAVRFYVETLGMKLVVDGASPVIDAGDGFRIELREGSGSASPVGLYSKVPMQEAIAILENRGITFDVKDDGTAHFRDLDENALYLCQER